MLAHLKIHFFFFFWLGWRMGGQYHHELIRYCPPSYVLCVSSHFWPFTIVKFVLEKLDTNLGLADPPPQLGQNPNFFEKLDLKAFSKGAILETWYIWSKWWGVMSWSKNTYHHPFENMHKPHLHISISHSPVMNTRRIRKWGMDNKTDCCTRGKLHPKWGRWGWRGRALWGRAEYSDNDPNIHPRVPVQVQAATISLWHPGS